MVDLIALGELLIDFTGCGRSEAGMELFERNPGGAVANVAVAAARQGRSTAFIGKVGDDMHGHFLKTVLDSFKVDTGGLLLSKSEFTTLAFVSIAPDGERSFSFARKPGADTCLSPNELNRELLCQTKILHVGSLSMTDEPARSATLAAVQMAKAAGAVISYDPNYRASLWSNEEEAVRQMRALLPYVDMIKLSDAETMLLTDETEPMEAIRVLLSQGVKCAVVTCGSEGAYAGVGSETIFAPAYPTTAVDTTGAGDAFWGGFLARFLDKNLSVNELTASGVFELCQYGNATAACCVSKRGAIPAMPTRQEVAKRLKESIL